MENNDKHSPPFWGAKVVTDVTLSDIEPLINREALFAGRWQFRRGESADEWESLKQRKCEPLFAKIVAKCCARNIIRPMISYGYFKCSRINNGLVISDRGKTHRLEFPRERRAPNRCIADFFPEGFVAMQIVTVGSDVTRETTNQFSEGAYSDAFFLKGLAAEAAEAMAVLMHDRIRLELGGDAGVGERFSPGYPSFPDLFAQREILDLLEAKRIGVSLTETCQLVPEYSTSAIISIDPSAKIFRP